MKKYVLIISLAAFFLNACQNETELMVEEPIDLESLVRPVEPEINFEFNTPSYPLEVVYILQQEFKNEKTSENLTAEGLNEAEYVEHRLLELYPEKGYKGMMQDDQEILDEYLINYKAYEEELSVYEELMGIVSTQEEVVPFEEIELTKQEKAHFSRLDEIALEKVSGVELMRTSSNCQGSEITAALIIGNLSGNGLLVNVNIGLVCLADSRANSLAAQYYSDGVGQGGHKWDAFKHIYVSMHLRRYQTKAISKIVMDYWESKNANIEARDTRMDLHNNVIGRDTRYSVFRGSMLGDLNDWQQWGLNVYNYMEYCTNGMPMDKLHNWHTNSPSTFQAIANISSEPYNNIRYVYYKEGCNISPCWGVNCVPGYVCVNGNCVPDPNYQGCPNVRCPPGSICVSGTCVEI